MNTRMLWNTFLSCTLLVNTAHTSWFAYDRAVSATQKNSWADAQEMLTQLVTHNPDNPSLLYDTGVAAYHTKDFDRALAYFKRAFTMPEASKVLKEQAHFNAGNTYVALKQLEHAVQEYEQVLTLNPDNERARHNLEKIKELLEQQKQEKEEQQNNKEEKKEEPNQQENQDKDSSDQQNQDQSGDAGNKDQRSSQQNQGKDSSENSESSPEQESGESSDEHKDTSSERNNSHEHNKSDKDAGDEQPRDEKSEDAPDDERREGGDESQAKNEDGRTQENEQTKERHEQEQKTTHPPSGDQSMAQQEQHDQAMQEGNGQSDQGTHDDASQEELTACAAQERADRQPPMDAWLAQLLDEHEKHDGQLHKQMIKATVNKELAGKHGENCW